MRYLFLIMLLCSSMQAEMTRVLTPATLRALSRGRVTAIRHMSAPMTVAGTRGAQIAPDELYWKGGSDGLIANAEALEAEEKFDEAAAHYRRVLVEGATARMRDRAAIGWSHCQLRLGEIEPAIRRLRGVCARSSDRDVVFGATLPLALALTSTGEKTEAVDLLKKLLARYPDHPMAGQADGMILFITGD